MIQRLHHISILVRDMEVAGPFYDNVLGLTRKTRPDFGSPGAWYDVDGIEVHLIQTPDVPGRHEGHPAFTVADIRDAVAKCLAGGATLQQDTFVRTHDNSLSAFLRDPDGNLIELVSPPPAA